MSDCEHVICLHGIWMPGAGMLYVKHRLEAEAGYRASLFSYAPVTETLDDNAGKLAAVIGNNGRTHLVAHSLGGIVTLRALALYPRLPVGRVVCLGSPLSGSRAARNLSQLDWGDLVLGKTIAEGVLGDSAHSWALDVARTFDIGVIAGDMPIGVGRLVAGFDEPNDGTIAVAETRLPGAKDHLVMPVSHKGMLISRDVVDQAAAFLRRGEFLREH